MNKNISSVACGIFCIFAGFILYEDGIGIFFIGFGLLMLLIALLLMKTEKKDSFIYECKKSKIQDVSNIAALRAIAQRVGWKFVSDNKLIETFNKMKSNANAEKTQEFFSKASKIDVRTSEGEDRLYNMAISIGMIGTKKEFVELYKKTNKEKEEAAKAAIIKANREREEAKYIPIYNMGTHRNDFSGCEGWEMRTKVLANAVNMLNTAVDNLLNDRPFEMRKETSWAVMGGLASGIAGGAAGAMAAMDTQSRNAEIRRQNNQNATLNAQYFMYISGPKAKVLDDEKKRIAKKLDKSQVALWEADVNKTLFKKLKIETPKIYIFDNNRFVIYADYTGGETTLKNGSSAYIDGTVTAEIYENGVKISSMDVHLPLYDIKEGYDKEAFGKQEVSYDNVLISEKFPKTIITSGVFNRTINRNNIQVKFVDSKLYAVEKI